MPLLWDFRAGRRTQGAANWEPNSNILCNISAKCVFAIKSAFSLGLMTDTSARRRMSQRRCVNAVEVSCRNYQIAVSQNEQINHAREQLCISHLRGAGCYHRFQKLNKETTSDILTYFYHKMRDCMTMSREGGSCAVLLFVAKVVWLF